MYKIAVDCMGSDLGSKICVEGIKTFMSKHDNVEIYAFGKINELKELEKVKNVTIVDCLDVMKMTSGAIEAMRARNTSMYKAIVSVKENNYDGVVSAGSTGAFLSLASVKIKTVEGVDRAALITAMPTYGGGKVAVLDIGANLETSSDQLVQFAKMGIIYAQKLLNCTHPKVALLSNGAEDEKGTSEIKEANKKLREMNLEGFVGNIEGREAILGGSVDVLVTGGYAGNIFLKTYEGAAKMMSNMIKDAFKTNLSTKIGYLFAKKGFKEIKEKMNYESVGGAMLMGINSVAVKAHGSSNERAFAQAIEVCFNMVEKDFLNSLKEGVKNNA